MVGKESFRVYRRLALPFSVRESKWPEVDQFIQSTAKKWQERSEIWCLILRLSELTPVSNRATASSWIPGPSASLNSHGHCGQMERTELFIKIQILCFGSKWVLEGKWIQWQQILGWGSGDSWLFMGYIGALMRSYHTPQKQEENSWLVCPCVPWDEGSRLWLSFYPSKEAEANPSVSYSR